MDKIDLIQMDDWAGLYLNGELYHEGHSVPDFVYLELFRNLGTIAKETWLEAEDALDEFGNRMPKHLKEFKWNTL